MKPERNIGRWIDTAFIYLFVWIPTAILILTGIVIFLFQVVLWLKTGEWTSYELEKIIPFEYAAWVFHTDTWWIMKKIGLFLLAFPISLASILCGILLLSIGSGWWSED